MKVKLPSSDFQMKKRKERYDKHRRIVEHSRSFLDLKPAKLPSGIFLRSSKLKSDFMAMKQVLRENTELLRKINCIQRNTGTTSNLNTDFEIVKSGRRRLNQNLNRIQKENYYLGCRLLTIKSSMDTRRGLEELRTRNKLKEKFAVPPHVLQQFQTVCLEEAHLLQKLLRPKIFFDLAERNLRPLGRITIQLFTEASPELILHFVRLCRMHSLNIFRFIRIFPGLWIEGELLKNAEETEIPMKSYHTTCIDHSSGPGILSFAECFLTGFPHGHINFTISFKPLPILNGRRVPFGIVIKGLRVLDCLQDYGTKNGKTKKDINIFHCGIAR